MGVTVTVTMQEEPGDPLGASCGQAPETLNGGVAVMLEIVTAVVPLLVIVTVWPALATPTF